MSARKSPGAPAHPVPTFTREKLGDMLLRMPELKVIRFSATLPAPPSMAYCTRFPRLALVLAGTHHEDIGAAGIVTRLKLGAHSALWIPADGWNLPRKESRSLVMSFLFGYSQVGLSLIDTRDAHLGQVVHKFALRNPSDPVLQGIVQAMTSSGNDERDPVASPLLTALIRRTAKLLSDNSLIAEGKGRLTYESLRLHIQQHIIDDVSRESVARHFRITPSHVSRLFQAHGGMTFSHYLRFVRVNHAKHLMRQHGLSLKEVAVASGFSDQPHFNRVFLKLVKTTPAAYRADCERAAADGGFSG